ncbi:MAG: hypothetical protein RQ885_09240 [Desulfurococcales archaeon]|jgi:hypothetical protein|nr:hypothetical protein [Desulfurococcales archaeon]
MNARRLGHRIRITWKIESYSITHNGVRPLIPLQRANTRDPSIETPPFRAGRGHIVPYMAIYVRNAMMWNLPRREFEALADALEIKDHPDLLWNLTGGTPRLW